MYQMMLLYTKAMFTDVVMLMEIGSFVRLREGERETETVKK